MDVELQIKKAEIAKLCLENALTVLRNGLKSDGVMDDEQIAMTMSDTKEYLDNAMHWQPMTPGAVFEEGKQTHVCLLTNGAMFLLYPLDGGKHFATRTGFQNADEGGVKISSETTVTVPRDHITHYARITEPK